jgi:hypothetical protein
MRAEARARLLAAIAKARFLARQADPRRFTSTAEIALTSAAANARRCATRGNPAGRGPARRNANLFRPAVPEHLAAAAPVRPETM